MNADARALDLGAMLKSQREALGISAADAEKAQIDESWWEELETGYVAEGGAGPSVRVLERAANVVGLTLTLARQAP